MTDDYLVSATTTPEEGTVTDETVHDNELIRLMEIVSRTRRFLDFTVRRVSNTRSLRGEVPEQLLHEESEARAAHEVSTRAVNEHERSYRGWSRFWLVTSSDGHIHRTTGCSTCNHRTEFCLLPELSGLAEPEAVEAHGAILCTVCFPTAPVEWTGGVAKAKVEARAEREAKKAQREAERAAKALLPDGKALEVGSGRWPQYIRTLAAAKSWLTDAYEWNLDHPSYPLESVVRVAEAISAKTGESVEAVREAARKRAAKRGG